MDLKKFLPSQEENDNHEYLWALVIEPGWVQAGIWRIDGRKAQVMFTGTPQAWELDEELISAADTALSVAIQNYPDDLADPSKTVFGVVSYWVSEGEIKREFLERIKNICAELSLKPVGFVVLPEAIAHLIKSEEGSPLNGVALGVYKDDIEISVFRLGNLSGSTKVARSVSVADDVAEGLSRLSVGQAVPSRLLLYDGKEGELEEVRQALIKADWAEYEKLEFLHTPKIEVIESQKKVLAVSLAGASELADVTAVQAAEKEERVEKGKTEGQVKEEVESEESTTPGDFGFAIEKDVAQEKSQKRKATEDKEKGDVPSPAAPVTTQVSKDHDNIEPVSEDKRKLPLLSKLPSLGILDKIKRAPSFFSFNMFGKLPAVGKRPLFFGVLFLLLILVAGLVSWWYFPKATVTVYVAPKRLEERMSISIDPRRSETNFEERVLKGTLLETDISGEKTKSTTGVKTVGERAKGNVTIYRVGSEIDLPSGTEIIGPDNLTFSLDEAVVVASGSAGTPGTAKVSVTATDIGAQYNLASGTTFRVDNYSTSDMEAKNESSFSGGTSREISAVSAEDQEELEEELTDELREKAREELLQETSTNEFFVDGSLIATSSSRTFSNMVGDEASTLRLALELETNAIAVAKDELTQVVRRNLEEKIPQGFVLREEQVDYDFELKEQEGGVYDFSVQVSANLLPEVDVENIAQKIAGKHPVVVEEFFPREVPGFVRAEIKINPNLPGRLGTLPRVHKNITVEVAAER